MKTSFRSIAITGLATVLLASGGAAAQEAHVGPVTEFFDGNVRAWLADPAIVDAIKAQNAAHAALAQADIDALDQKWRAEVDGGDRPTIDAVLGNAASQFLKGKQESAGGLVTEVFIMDNKGLNVGQSDVTSDYWQGDEAKWQKTFGDKADALFVDEAEKDESTQMLQSQVSSIIKDPASGEAIGAITIGVNLDAL
ncbi:hypothetical protein LXM94_08860 [Rhizobium sp. TRM95111]|uniref:hypothetical protein n=1 Tax=Rhizobium alarense TaxID=2846851 RepID=UPI001F288D68|nr:hypothetical protein [Rhizobium alarense]MCF3640078.1 hypothetical protein [Rhizobium alarense]